jgi:CheY-like chemotaxis protein
LVHAGGRLEIARRVFGIVDEAGAGPEIARIRLICEFPQKAHYIDPIKVTIVITAPKPMDNVDPTPRTPPTEGGQLLIVDDEAVIRFVLRCELEQRGYTVTEVEDGRRALEQFSRDPSRWLGAFVDFLLPDAHGDELIDQFLALRPDLPVVLMTGDCDPSIERMANERNLTILRKPFPLERLRPLLQDMRRHAQANAAAANAASAPESSSETREHPS